MSNSIVSVDSSITATNAAKMMENTGVGVIVVLENSMPVEIITDRGFAIKITVHSYPIDLCQMNNVFSSVFIDPNFDLWSASDLMSTRDVRKLPVIDDDDKVVGIITSSDLIKHIADH